MVPARCYCDEGIREIGQELGTVDALVTPTEDGVRAGGGGERRPKAEEQGGEADITTRGNSGWRATAPTLRECTVEFQMVWRPGDAVLRHWRRPSSPT